MGDEFGHPEWIDFPRSGNGWSYRYARRQWHLVDDPELKYHQLCVFDREMIRLSKSFLILEYANIVLRHEHNDDKVIAFERGPLLFVFNFHPNLSFPDYHIQATPGSYQMVLDSDANRFGGHNRRLADQTHHTLSQSDKGSNASAHLSLYLPARTAIVLKKI